MYSCGEVGQSRADEVLLRVPLKLQEQNSDLKVDSQIRAGEIVGVLKDVNRTCFEYKRESVRRTVCRVWSLCPDCNPADFPLLDCRPNAGFRQRLWLGCLLLYIRGGLAWTGSHRGLRLGGIYYEW